jgi:hypothetical protein
LLELRQCLRGIVDDALGDHRLRSDVAKRADPRGRRGMTSREELGCAAAFVGSYRLLPARPQNVDALRSVNGMPGIVLARASERLGATQ